MGEHRFQGEWPKIGIRPTIDGRMGGVRESLEKQTMDMAKSVVKLLTKTLQYPDGTPIQPSDGWPRAPHAPKSSDARTWR